MLINLKFEMPHNTKQVDEFVSFISKIAYVKDEIYKSIKNNERIVNTFDIDKYVFDDFEYLLSGRGKSPVEVPRKCSLWSFHRTEPRWGSPLFSLYADNLNESLNLILKIQTDWSDIEEVPKSIYFRCNQSLNNISDEWNAITSAKGIDYWLEVKDNYLNIYMNLK